MLTNPIGFVVKPTAALVAALALLSSACGGDGMAAPADRGPVTVRLGYFPNLTHATAVAGVESGTFARALAPHRLKTTTFNAGPAAVEALFSGAVDATYIGPNPAINAYVKSSGKAIRIISGAASGGAALVVKQSIDGSQALAGTKLASPQLGGTQDVALRAWLASKGLRTGTDGGGEVSVLPQENAQTLETFRGGQIDGAWVPEPWATRMVQEAGGRVLVDERDLWPGGRFVTTHLVVRTEFLRRNPAVVRRLLQGQVEANRLLNSSPPEAQKLVNSGMAKITGKALPDDVIRTAWHNVAFTNDPIATSLPTAARQAQSFGLLPNADLKGIYDLRPLNEVLRSAGEQEVRVE